MSGLSITDLVVRYGEQSAVDRVSLKVDDGEVVALIGPSGCGKSSLLRAVAGLEPVAGGSVRWDGADLDGVPVHRRGFGLMFQDGQLFAHRDVAGNIAFGLQMSKVPRSQRRDRVAQLLDLVGLPGYGDRAVASLSGGQAQRVALARSLAPAPRLLLLDEPLSALDRELRERLAGELHGILRKAGTTVLYVTHDHDEAFTVADRVAVMIAGQVVQVGPPDEIWARPASAQVAAFLGYHLTTDPDGLPVAVSPHAFTLLDDAGTRRDGVVTAAASASQLSRPLAGHVTAVGFSRGRTTAVVDLPGWGEQRVIAPGVADVEPGSRVTIQWDPAAMVRLDKDEPDVV